MSADCAHVHAAPPAETDVSAALERAEALSADGGRRWTEPRRRVYELLLRAAAPVKAYDLMELYGPERTAKPPTVYRALEFLEQTGLAHRIASLNAYVACGTDDGHPHAAAFLICDCCGSAEEFDPGRIPAAAAEAALRGFTPRAVALEVRGACARCG